MSLFVKDLILLDAWERASQGLEIDYLEVLAALFFLSRKFARSWMLFARTQSNAV